MTNPNNHKTYGKTNRGRDLTLKEFWSLYMQKRLRELKSKNQIAKELNISTATLYKRLYEHEKPYRTIEQKYTKLVNAT